MLAIHSNLKLHILIFSCFRQICVANRGPFLSEVLRKRGRSRTFRGCRQVIVLQIHVPSNESFSYVPRAYVAESEEVGDVWIISFDHRYFIKLYELHYLRSYTREECYHCTNNTLDTTSHLLRYSRTIIVDSSPLSCRFQLSNSRAGRTCA